MAFNRCSIVMIRQFPDHLLNGQFKSSKVYVVAYNIIDNILRCIALKIFTFSLDNAFTMDTVSQAIQGVTLEMTLSSRFCITDSLPMNKMKKVQFSNFILLNRCVLVPDHG